MNIMTNKDRFIRGMKLLRDFSSVVALFYVLLLMFCDHEKVVAAIFSTSTFGITALITGVILGFALGVYITCKVFEADDAETNGTKGHEKKYPHKTSKKHHKPNNTKKSNNTKQHNKAPQPQTSQAQAVQPQTTQPQIIIFPQWSESKTNELFGLLCELDEPQNPVNPTPEHQVSNDNSQEISSNEEP